jgi:hypothetical protein
MLQVATPARPRHTLILYRSGERADDALRSMCRRALDGGSLVSVVVLAREEDALKGCCDTRSVLWNRVCRDIATEDLSRAARAVGTNAGIEFGILAAPNGKVADSVAREAVARDADEIVFADPRGSGLGRLELRRLRRNSPVPVRA